MPWETGEPFVGFTKAAKPWLPVPDLHHALAVDHQERDTSSVLSHYRRMLAFRRGRKELTQGTIEFIGESDEVLAFVRRKSGRALLFVFNLTREVQRFNLLENMLPFAVASAPGFSGTLNDRAVELEPLTAYCAAI
jgi:alpha-glucosidase